jgi:hypothetical protein
MRVCGWHPLVNRSPLPGGNRRHPIRGRLPRWRLSQSLASGGVVSPVLSSDVGLVGSGHRTLTPKVTGSNPVRHITIFSSSMVERPAVNRMVSGSSPEGRVPAIRAGILPLEGRL